MGAAAPDPPPLPPPPAAAATTNLEPADIKPRPVSKHRSHVGGHLGGDRRRGGARSGAEGSAEEPDRLHRRGRPRRRFAPPALRGEGTGGGRGGPEGDTPTSTRGHRPYTRVVGPTPPPPPGGGNGAQSLCATDDFRV